MIMMTTMGIIANTNWPKHFSHINSFNSFNNNPMKRILLVLIQFFRWGK